MRRSRPSGTLPAPAALAALAAFAWPAAALAHSLSARFGDFYGSLLHPASQATEETGNAFLDLYNRVVGQSYVPDLVTEAGGWFDRLTDDMTSKTGEATSAVSEAFAGLDRQVSYPLGSMIAHKRVALADFASLAQDTLAQILGGLISVGINAGISSIFAPSPATAGGGGATIRAQVAHRGGIAGDPSSPARSVPWAAFLGAERYHAGGLVLGRDEVPIIARRGERVVPAGQDAGGWS